LNLSAKSDIFKEDITGGKYYMKNDQDDKVGNGCHNRPKGATPLNDKVLRVFTKLKRRADSSVPASSGPGGQGTPIREIEPNVEELRHSAMNSYRVGPEVLKTDT